TFTAVWHYRQGQPEQAVEILESVLKSHPEMDGIRPHLAIALSMLGRHEEARAQLTDRVKQLADADHDSPYWLASAYALEGLKDEAFEWLERAIAIGNENLPWFESNPVWASLRDDERFRTLIARVEQSQATARANVE